jgi:lipopolysaccharide export system permease protein
LTILDRYVIREFLKVFAICLAGFLLVSLLIELTDKIKLYFEHNPSGWLMLKYFLVKIPGYLYFAFPLAILLAGMLSLLMMAKNSELIAMQANGIDALSIAGPVLAIGLAASVLMFCANETIIPWSNAYSEYIQNVEIAHKSDTTFFKEDQIWVRTRNKIVHIAKFDRAASELENVTTVSWDDDYNFTERVFGEKAVWWGNQWMFYGVNRTVRKPDGSVTVENLPAIVGPLDRSPEDFLKTEKPTKEMNLAQLNSEIAKVVDEGRVPGRLLVDWHDKIAFPFICLIMAALSVPFSIKVNPRGGGIAVGIALSMITAFSYWIVHSFFIALGHGGYIPPIPAAWGPNTIFGFTALFLLLKAGT